MRTFSYVRFGQLEIGRSDSGMHVTVFQPDGHTATYWLSEGEAEDLHARLGGMLQEWRAGG